jgi:hypothetical protein
VRLVKKPRWSASSICRSRISPSWFFVLPDFLLGPALENRSKAVEAPCPVGAAAEVHYGPGEDLEGIDVALIREAVKQVDMTAYVLTDCSAVRF